MREGQEPDLMPGTISRQIAALFAAILLVGGCQAGAAPTPQIIYVTPAPATVSPNATASPTATASPVATHVITGALRLAAGSTQFSYLRDNGCAVTTGAYSDVAEGVTVTVKDQAGVVVGR